MSCNTNRQQLSQGRIEAMIQHGTERYILQGAAARREIARLRQSLNQPGSDAQSLINPMPGTYR